MGAAGRLAPRGHESVIVVPRHARQEQIVRQAVTESEEAGQHGNDALVPCRLMVADQGIVHDHVRPDIDNLTVALAFHQAIEANAVLAVFPL